MVICLIISYFCSVLFPIDLVTKQGIIEGGQKSFFSSFLTDFSARQAWSISRQYQYHIKQVLNDIDGP